MLLEEQRAIFLHVNKTAGVSIGSTLRGRDVSADHKTARWYANHMPGKWERYTTFAFVRNPWDKEVADYMFHKGRPSSDVRKQNHTFKQYLHAHMDPSYKWYLPPEDFPPNEHLNWCWHRHQLDWISLDGVEPAVDFVGRFERLHADFAVLCDMLDVPHKKLKHHHKSGHTQQRRKDPKAYCGHYDDETRELVGRFYEKDVRAFGYHFGDPASTG